VGGGKSIWERLVPELLLLAIEMPVRACQIGVGEIEIRSHDALRFHDGLLRCLLLLRNIFG